VWERDGHRVRLIDRRLDDATRETLPAYIVVERVCCWHEDVVDAVQLSRYQEYAMAGPLIGWATLVNGWELVEED